MNTLSFYQQLQNQLDPLMASNINDDLTYNPKDNLTQYINDILKEIQYERENDIYTKNELDTLQNLCNKLLKQL